jgi:acyl-CoA thioesterase-1
VPLPADGDEGMNERRAWIMGTVGLALAGRGAAAVRGTTLFTFGDSVLDCGRYNEHGLDPGQLLVRNDDRLFPEFRGRDLRSQGPAWRVHRATDGATVDHLGRQALRIGPSDGRAVALLTIGGNDLLAGIAAGGPRDVATFRRTLIAFLDALPIRPVLVGNVYDPTFGDDRRNFLPVPPAAARAQHARLNEVLREAGERYGRAVDLHAHFLRGDDRWFTRTIEPSLVGASEVRRAFLAAL